MAPSGYSFWNSVGRLVGTVRRIFEVNLSVYLPPSDCSTVRRSAWAPLRHSKAFATNPIADRYLARIQSLEAPHIALGYMPNALRLAEFDD